MFIYLLMALFFLAWGSFLNVVGHRLINGWSSLRSHCPSCKHTLSAQDIIPVISYMLLGGHCRHCHTKIHWLYPAIELFTVLSLFAGYFLIDESYHAAYFIFFSALIVTIRSDIEHMLISQWVTLALIPFGFVLSLLDMLPVLPLFSILGAAFGYLLPWLIGKTFHFVTKKEGIGEGDFDLLAFIGAFTGIVGVWFSLLIGSILGSLIGGLYLYTSGKMKKSVPIPFGPFLAIGAMLFAIFAEIISDYLFIS